MLILNKVTKIFKRKIKSWNIIKDFLFPKYEKFYALKNISFEIKQWEKVAFIWPNWAWKSTTIKSILWILHYDEWKIEIFNKDPKKDRVEILKNISSVFWQRSQLLYHLPLIDSFKFYKIIYEISDQYFSDRLNKLTNIFKINEFIDFPVRKLSLWQRMKWEIIAWLLHWPKAIFLDEPTVGLDIIAKKTLHEVLLWIHKQENITIFLTSHDLKDIEALCERTIIINKWEIIYDWEIKQLFKKYWNKKLIKYKLSWEIDWNITEIENNSKLLEESIRKLFNENDIEDLQVENVPLEEIIEQFYN